MTTDPRARLNPTPEWTRMDLLLVGFLTIAGAVLRITGLNEGMWMDEMQTLHRYVELPVSEIITSYDNRNNHILYSVAAHYSVAWFGESAWALRLPAALAGIATIPAAYYLGRQLTTRNEAFLAGALLVASYHHVWFSQNARGYTGLLLGAVLLSSCFIRLLTTGKPGYRTVFAYSIIAALATWIHLTAALVVLAHGITWLVLISPLAGKQRIRVKWTVPVTLLLAGLYSLALYAPLLGTLTTIFLPQNPLPTMLPSASDPVPANPSAWNSFGWLLNDLAAGAHDAVPGGWPVILLAALATFAGVWSYLNQGILPAALLMLPVLVTFISVSFLASVFPRFLFGSLVFFLLIGVRGGLILSRTVLPMLNNRQMTVLWLIIAVAAAAKVPHAWNPKQDYLGAAEFIAQQRAPGDAVVCGPQMFPLHSYLGMDCQRVASVDELSALEQAHARTWFLYSIPLLFQHNRAELWTHVQRDYTLIATFKGTVHGGDIVIMMKAAETPR